MWFFCLFVCCLFSQKWLALYSTYLSIVSCTFLEISPMAFSIMLYCLHCLHWNTHSSVMNKNRSLFFWTVLSDQNKYIQFLWLLSFMCCFSLMLKGHGWIFVKSPLLSAKAEAAWATNILNSELIYPPIMHIWRDGTLPQCHKSAKTNRIVLSHHAQSVSHVSEWVWSRSAEINDLALRRLNHMEQGWVDCYFKLHCILFLCILHLLFSHLIMRCFCKISHLCSTEIIAVP